MKKTKTDPSIDLANFDFEKEMARLGVATGPTSLTKGSAGLATMPKSKLTKTGDTVDAPSNPFFVMIVMTIVTIVLSFIPFAQIATYPFQLFVTFIHEISHAVTALATGGSVLGRSLTARWDASGEVQYTGGIQILVSSAGYVGSTLFGCLLMMIAKKPKLAKPTLIATAVLISIFTLLYGGTLSTLIIGAGLVAALFSIVKFTKQKTSYYFLSFLSIQSILNAVYNIRILFGPHTLSDADILSSATGIPAFLWSTSWLLISFGMLFFVMMNYYKMFKNGSQPKI